MSVTGDLLHSWRHPRLVFARQLAGGVQEDRALSLLVLALVLIFVAQTPGLARAAHMHPEVPLAQRLLAAFLGVLALLPVLYLLAWGSAAVAGISGYGARLALFWSLLAACPLVLGQGLLTGLFGPGAAITLIGVAVFAGFLGLWAAALAEVRAQGRG